MDTSPSTRRATFLALIGVAAVAFVVRLHGTGERTLFWDEAYHLELAQIATVGDMLATILTNPPSDPLYALLLRGWAGIFGTSDVALRLPSVVFGAATVLATAWLAWELSRDRRAALAAAAVAAIAPYAVEFGQEASLYVLATLWVTLALAAGWRWRRTAARTDAALAILLAIVAVYSHYVAPAVLGLAALVAATPWAGPSRVPPRHLVGAGAVVLLAWLPWLVPMAASWLATPFPRTAIERTATPAELAGALSQYASGTGALLERMRLVQALGVAAAGLLLVRGWLLGSRPDLRGFRVVVVVAGVLFIVPWLASVATGRWLFVAHLMLPILPALFAVAAAGAVLPGTSRWRTVGPLALAGLLIAQIGGLYVNAVAPPHGNDGVRELVAVLDAQARPGEPVFMTPAENQIIVEHYWAGDIVGLPEDVDLARLYGAYDPAPVAAASIARFEQVAGSVDRAWLLYGPERDRDGRLLQWLRTRGVVGVIGTYRIADLYVIDLR